MLYAKAILNCLNLGSKNCGPDEIQKKEDPAPYNCKATLLKRQARNVVSIQRGKTSRKDIVVDLVH